VFKQKPAIEDRRLGQFLTGDSVKNSPALTPEHIPHLNRYVPDFMAYDRSLKAGEEKC